MAEFLANTAQLKNIQNPNELNATNFKLVFRNLRLDNSMLDFQLTCTIGNLPGVQQNSPQIHTPMNHFNVQGAKLYFDDLNLNFKVDEDLNNWAQVYSWLRGITAPVSTEEFVNYQGLPRPQRYEIGVDASLISLTNVMNPNMEIVFRNIMPITLGGVQFDLGSPNNEILRAEASFRYDYFDIRRAT